MNKAVRTFWYECPWFHQNGTVIDLIQIPLIHRDSNTDEISSSNTSFIKIKRGQHLWPTWLGIFHLQSYALSLLSLTRHWVWVDAYRMECNLVLGRVGSSWELRSSSIHPNTRHREDMKIWSNKAQSQYQWIHIGRSRSTIWSWLSGYPPSRPSQSQWEGNTFPRNKVCDQEDPPDPGIRRILAQFHHYHQCTR